MVSLLFKFIDREFSPSTSTDSGSSHAFTSFSNTICLLSKPILDKVKNINLTTQAVQGDKLNTQIGKIKGKQ